MKTNVQTTKTKKDVIDLPVLSLECAFEFCWVENPRFSPDYTCEMLVKLSKRTAHMQRSDIQTITSNNRDTDAF